MPNAQSPFDPQSDSAYQRWREKKLANLPDDPDALLVEVGDPGALTTIEANAIKQRCKQTNMVIYASSREMQADRDTIKRLGIALGLQRLDHTLCADKSGITLLQVEKSGDRPDYIPYTDRPLNWHTDGYYNDPDRQVRAFVLHCITSAHNGGENALMDPEIAFIRLRDRNPGFIKALMHPSVMTIPANVVDGVTIRPTQTGPVFSVDPETGSLHMRYTARKRSIEWRDDAVTSEAVRALESILSDNDASILHYCLQPGQGLVCNNVLHNRTRFEDDDSDGGKRGIFRARYHDRIADTDYLSPN